MYGDEISDMGILIAQEELLSRLFSPLVRERNTRGLRWIVSIVEARPDFLKQVPTGHTVEEFQARLRDCITNPTSDEAQPLIAAIATACGIEPTPDSLGSDPQTVATPEQ